MTAKGYRTQAVVGNYRGVLRRMVPPPCGKPALEKKLYSVACESV